MEARSAILSMYRQRSICRLKLQVSRCLHWSSSRSNSTSSEGLEILERSSSFQIFRAKIPQQPQIQSRTCQSVRTRFDPAPQGIRPRVPTSSTRTKKETTYLIAEETSCRVEAATFSTTQRDLLPNQSDLEARKGREEVDKNVRY